MMRTTSMLMIATAATAVVASCATDHPRECRTFGRASICLQKIGASHFVPEGSGLQPGSRVHLQLTGAADPSASSALAKEAPLVADASGRWPTGTGLVTGDAPAGSVTITMTATSVTGDPITATFTR